MAHRSSLTLAAVLAVLGFLLVTATRSQPAARPEDPRKERLAGLIRDRRALVDDLDEAVETLRADVAAARRRAVRARELDRAHAERLSSLAAQAGTTPVRGGGIEVTLADSERRPPSREEAGAYRIHDRDLQVVVNALFSAGAEAVAINDSRLVATSAIRSAGDTIVVNFRPLTPPYRIVAAAADKAVFESDAVTRRFRRWSKLFGLGFAVRTVSDLTIPPYAGRVSITAAGPVPGNP